MSSVVRANRTQIATWAKTAAIGDRQAFMMAVGRGGVGRVMIRGATSSVAGQTVRVVLKKEAFKGKLYDILTAFPEP